MVPRAWPALCGPARGRPLGPLLPLRGGASPEGGLRGSARPPCARQGPARSLARAGAVRPGRLLIGAGRRGPRDRGERRAAALPGTAGGGALRVFNAPPEVPPFTRRPDAHGAVPVGTSGRVPALRFARNHALLGLEFARVARHLLFRKCRREPRPLGAARIQLRIPGRAGRGACTVALALCLARGCVRVPAARPFVSRWRAAGRNGAVALRRGTPAPERRSPPGRGTRHRLRLRWLARVAEQPYARRGRGRLACGCGALRDGSGARRNGPRRRRCLYRRGRAARRRRGRLFDH